MIEKEVRGIMNTDEFRTKLTSFNNLSDYAKSYNRRLTFCFGDFNNTELDLRLRITNGEAVLIQKVGTWTNLQREEVEVKVNSFDDFYKLLRIFKNIYETIPNSFATIIQHENYLFEDGDTEIKLTKQFGKNDYYVFEVEAKNSKVNLDRKCKELQLVVTDNFESEEDRKRRNESVNLSFNELAEDKIAKLIQEYLNYNGTTYIQSKI